MTALRFSLRNVSDNPVLGVLRPRQGFPIIVAGLFLTSISTACASEFALTDATTAIGEITTQSTTADQTLMDVARANDVGYTELMAVNPGVNAWLPGNGALIKVPGFHLLPDAPREGIVLNVAARRLFYFPKENANGERRVETFPVAIGAMNSATPEGITKIVRGVRLPTWYPPESIRRKDPSLPGAVPPGRDNPLGKFAFYLDWPQYLIHGTNQPDGIGRAVSHGCIQLYPEDIQRLSEIVPIGTKVHIVNQEFALAMHNGDLYLEVHPSLHQSEAIEVNTTHEPEPPVDLQSKVKAFAEAHDVRMLDWAVVEKAGKERDGIPVVIGHGTASLTTIIASNDRTKLYPADLYFLP